MELEEPMIADTSRVGLDQRTVVRDPRFGGEAGLGEAVVPTRARGQFGLEAPGREPKFYDQCSTRFSQREVCSGGARVVI